MRVTNQMSMNAMKLYLSQNMSSLAKSQEMLASGHRINKTSDDPIGAINTMRFTTNIVETEEYIEKIDQSTNFMNTTDSALNNVNSVLQRARELVVYAANGTQNDTSRNAIADELKQLREQLNLIANTTYGSKNIFSGTNVTTSPYDADNNVWQGNTDALNLEIGTGVTITINSIMQNFFYNTGSTMSGQTVDLSRLTDTSQLTDKTFNLVFDDLQKVSRFVTITQDDIDNAGWGHPSAEDFKEVVKSSLSAAGSTEIFSYNASTDSFYMNTTRVYLKTNGGLKIANDSDLAQLQSHGDLEGNLGFYTDAACGTSYTTGSTLINDTRDISQAAGWRSSITRSQFNTIVTGVAKTGGFALTYNNASGSYSLNGVDGKLQVGGVDVDDTFLKGMDDHSALSGKAITFVANSTGSTTPVGTVLDSDIATTDWGLNPTDDQYKNILQNAINRSLGVISSDNFAKVVNSSLTAAGSAETFSTDGTKFYLNNGVTTTQVYMKIGSAKIGKEADLEQFQHDSDLQGTLEFYTDSSCAIAYGTPSLTTDITDTDIATQATQTSGMISPDNLAKVVNSSLLDAGSAETFSTDGTNFYLNNGVTTTQIYMKIGSTQISEDTDLTQIQYDSDLQGTLAFYTNSACTTSYGTPSTEITDTNIAKATKNKPKVLVEGSQSAGYSLKMDSSLLPTDGSPSQVKIRTLGSESFGTIGNAAAAMPLDENSLSQTVMNYFSGLNPEGNPDKYAVTYDLGTHQFSISIDGGTPKTGNIVLVDENGNETEITNPQTFAASNKASALLGMKVEFKEAATGTKLPLTNPDQPVVTAEDLRPATILNMDETDFAANMTAFFNNLFSGHTLDLDPSDSTKIKGIDGITGKLTVGGKEVNDITAYLTANGNDFSKLSGLEVVFTPDSSVINNNQITYVDASTGNQVKESSAAFTMGGQGLKGRGVRYQDDNIGVMQLLDRIIIDVQAGNHDNIDSNLSVIDDRMDALNSERSVIGARVNRLELQKDRMTTSKENYTSLLSRYQDADMAQVIMDLNMQENVYRASLAAGARIIMPSLMDYLN